MCKYYILSGTAQQHQIIYYPNQVINPSNQHTPPPPPPQVSQQPYAHHHQQHHHHHIQMHSSQRQSKAIPIVNPHNQRKI